MSNARVELVCVMIRGCHATSTSTSLVSTCRAHWLALHNVTTLWRVSRQNRSSTGEIKDGKHLRSRRTRRFPHNPAPSGPSERIKLGITKHT